MCALYIALEQEKLVIRKNMKEQSDIVHVNLKLMKF